MTIMDPAPTAIPTAADLSWEIDIGLLTNRMMLGAVVRVFGIAALIMGGLLTLLFGVQGEWDVIGTVWLATLVMTGGLLLLSVLVMALVFRNRMRFRFTVGAEGVRCETIDRTARATNRLAVVAGVLLGSPQALGAGLMAGSQETQEVAWSGSFRAQYRPRARVVILRNRWRRLMIVYCTAEGYAAVADRIRAEIDRSGAEERLPAGSPLPRALGLSAAVVVACLPLFILTQELDVPLWMPLLLICFALAMVWLVGAFGWVVLGSVALIAGAVAMDAVSLQESFLYPGETYAHWTVFSGDVWALLVLAVVGAGALVGLAVAMLRGRIRSMLDSDMADMGGQ
jgi:hypothetical protein